MLITFSGLDGAGKSTLIERLRTALEQRNRRVTVFHIHDHVGVYASLRALRDRLRPPAPTNGRGRVPAGRLTALYRQIRHAALWNKPLRRLIYPLDLLVFLGYRLYVEALRGRVLVMDRYFYDTLVDVAGGSWGWLRLLQEITPTPDLAVFLEVTPEESFARKGEYSIPYLRGREAAYRQVFSWVPAAVALPNRDVDETARILERLAVERLSPP
jgi:thymidylate kinase